VPVAALDYQSLGQLRDASAIHDAVKREALRSSWKSQRSASGITKSIVLFCQLFVTLMSKFGL